MSKGLIHVRVDDRLIHGQVAIYWCNGLQASRVLVANDEMYSNELQKAALRLVVPTGLSSSMLSIQKAEDNLSEGKYAGQRVLLVVRRIEDLVELINKGVEFDAVNIGNLPAREGTRLIKKSINMTPGEMELVKKLNIEFGIRFTGKQVPDNSDEDLMQLL